MGALAYIGDSRHSLYVRKMLVKRGIAKSGELNSIALGYVTAEAQAAAYEKIKRHKHRNTANVAHVVAVGIFMNTSRLVRLSRLSDTGLAAASCSRMERYLA